MIEDDLFGDLFFGQKRPQVAKAFDGRAGTLVQFSIKTLTPGSGRLGLTRPVSVAS